MITPALPQDVPFAIEAHAPVIDHGLLSDNKVSHIVKEMLLRHWLKKEVKANEAQAILTDVSVTDLASGRTIFGHNESAVHFAASVNKLPVTMLVLEELRAGRLTLDTPLTWIPSDRRAGNGMYDLPDSPTTGTVRQVLHDLLNRSGNTAVRILVNYTLGGATAVNNRLAAVSQIPNTRLIPLDENRFYLGNTTSKEALFVLQKVLEGSDSYQQYVKELLATNIFVNDGVRSQLAGNNFILLVNKTGLLFDPDGDNFHDVGIIYNNKTQKAYGYAMLTTAPHDSPTAPQRADQSLKFMGKDILCFAGDTVVKEHSLAPKSAAQSSAEHGKVLY